MLNTHLTTTEDLVESAIALHNRGVQPNLFRSKLNDLFTNVGNQLQHANTDFRRSIHEYNGADFSIQKFEVYSEVDPLGRHFHIKSAGKTALEYANAFGISEIFIFDKGSGTILLQNVGTNGEALGKIEKFRFAINDIIVIPPYQAHTFYCKSGTQFRGFRPYPFDKKDMDMNPYPLAMTEK